LAWETQRNENKPNIAKYYIDFAQQIAYNIFIGWGNDVEPKPQKSVPLRKEFLK
jgi:hypothetical protein